MDLARIAALLCSIVLALIGFKAILTREIALSQDDDRTEPNLWLYGWRAAAVGGLFVLAALLCLGVAAGDDPRLVERGAVDKPVFFAWLPVLLAASPIAAPRLLAIA